MHCPSIPSKRSLIIGSQNTKLNTRVKFSCARGNNLIGATEIVCLPSGNWSDPIPACESKFIDYYSIILCLITVCTYTDKTKKNFLQK